MIRVGLLSSLLPWTSSGKMLNRASCTCMILLRKYIYIYIYVCYIQKINQSFRDWRIKKCYRGMLSTYKHLCTTSDSRFRFIAAIAYIVWIKLTSIRDRIWRAKSYWKWSLSFLLWRIRVGKLEVSREEKEWGQEQGV